MLPILVSLGPIKIYSYGVFLAMALFLGMYWWWRIGRDEHWDEISLFDAYFLAAFVYLLCARGAYVLLHPGLREGFRYLALLAYPGVDVFWGLVGVLAVAIPLSRYKGWEEWRALDGGAVAASVILMISAVGSLLNNPDWKLGLWGMLVTIVGFVLVSRVRKNFRFYSWYKGEASSAKDGLALLVLILVFGVYYLPLNWIQGLVLASGAAGMVYLRSGKNRGEELLNKLLRRKI